MARNPNTKEIITSRAVSYIVNQLQDASADFHEELDIDNKLKTTYISARDGSAKSHLDNAIKMLRWLIESQFGRPSQAALTDAQVDIIDLNIRTLDDRT